MIILILSTLNKQFCDIIFGPRMERHHHPCPELHISALKDRDNNGLSTRLLRQLNSKHTKLQHFRDATVNDFNKFDDLADFDKVHKLTRHRFELKGI